MSKPANFIEPASTGYFTPRVRLSNSVAIPLRAGSLTSSIRIKVERAKESLQLLDYEPGNPSSKAIVVDIKQ